MIILTGKDRRAVVQLIGKAWAIADAQLEHGTDTRVAHNLCSRLANELDIYKEVTQSRFMYIERLK